MKNCSRLHRSFRVLLVSLSTTSLLSACDMLNIPNMFKDEHPQQTTIGERHPPALNPPVGPAELRQQMMAKPAVPAAMPAAPTATPSTPTPYDSYDTNGNQIAPLPSANEAPAPTPAPAAKEGTSSQGDSFFDRLFTRYDSSAAPSASPQEAQRKPLPGNPTVSKGTSVAAPVSPAPQVDTTPAQDNTADVKPLVPKAPMPVPAGVVQAPAAEAPAAAAPVPAPAAESAPVTPPAAKAASLPDNPVTSRPDDIVTDTTPLSAQPTEESQSPSGSPFLARTSSWFSRQFNNEDTAQPAPASAATENTTKQVAAPAAPAENKDTTQQPPAAAVAPVATQSEVVAPEAPSASAQPAPTQEEPSFFSRTSSWLDRQFGGEEAKPGEQPSMGGVTVDQNAPAPSLSNVPQVPSALQSTKEAAPGAMDALKNDQEMSQEQKATLDSEPSQQQMVPATSASDNNIAPSSASAPTAPQAPTKQEALPNPTKSSKDQEDKQSDSSTSDASGEPVLLGHLSAPPPAVLNAVPNAPTSNAPTASALAAPKPVAAPVTPVTSSDTSPAAAQ